MGDQHDEVLTERQAAALLKVGERTLQRWRAEGQGPAVLRLGGRRLGYLRSDVISWARSQLQPPGQQAAA